MQKSPFDGRRQGRARLSFYGNAESPNPTGEDVESRVVDLAMARF
jgi:hypothetical protein